MLTGRLWWIWALGSVGWAQAATYQPQIPQFQHTATERASHNQWQAIGQVHIARGMAVPAYAISVSDPIEDGLRHDTQACSRKSCDWPLLKLTVEQAQALVALRISGIGWVLAPKQWRDIDAAVGVNGSQSLLLKSPDGREWLTYYHSGACVGCAYSAAAPLFPAAHKLAVANDFGADAANPRITIVRPQAHRALFSYRLAGQHETHGVAEFKAGDDLPYHDLRVTMRPEHRGLAAAILNAGVY